METTQNFKLGYSLGAGSGNGVFNALAMGGDEGSLVPTDGYWEWKDNSTGLKYVPVSQLEKNRTKGGNQQSTRGGGGGGFAGRDQLIDMMKKQGIRIPGAPITIPSMSRKETTIEADQKVTLDNVKEVALIQSELSVTEEFSYLIQSQAFHNFLLSLLTYFNEYFKIVEIDNQPRGMVAEMSAVELKAREEANRNMQTSEKALGFNYSILILGLELPELHHMECGKSRVSSLHKDRALFEKMYTFSTYIVWICFKRPDIDLIKREIGRILKSDHFNPHARRGAGGASDQGVKGGQRANSRGGGVGAGTASFMERARMSETSLLKVTAEANKARKDLVKKAPIMSIVGQKSPVLRSLLPSTKEQAMWLFEKLDQESLKKHKEGGNKEDKTFKLGNEFNSDDLENRKIGIIGESSRKFNSITLVPVDKEKKGDKNKETTSLTNEETEEDSESKQENADSS
ncbi:protein phosphatase 1 regulatory subunit 36-like isoform X2 [Symsagittifera roscoffensis]|uniref:protein phosphatase 1 regulatory subunit 36-like isoform X2 n=1 Tax=Symsagittifera roscoffensis TaxID=84072 RepID=UPI00307C68F5